MIRFRHRNEGCESEVIRFIGDHEIEEMISSEWLWPDGTKIVPCADNVGVCPDCKRLVVIDAAWLVEI